MYFPHVFCLHAYRECGKGRVFDAAAALTHSPPMSLTVSGLPGMPQRDDDPEPDALPVEPDDAVPPMPGVPEPHGHEPVELPKA